MSKEKLVIELEPWDYTCGDGCCYIWGTKVKVNGVELEGDADSNNGALQTVLEYLGYEVEIKG